MKGQDLVVMLKLASRVSEGWTYSSLARDLGMSASEVHAAVRRCQEAGLYNVETRQPVRHALLEFLVHGVRYVFPVRPGAIGFGLPTSYAVSPLREQIRFEEAETPVMPLLRGTTRGPEVKPLYSSAPQAAATDAKLHQLLAMVDVLRMGRARERKMAEQVLGELLQLA